jgi:hypothetical protein
MSDLAATQEVAEQLRQMVNEYHQQLVQERIALLQALNAWANSEATGGNRDLQRLKEHLEVLVSAHHRAVQTQSIIDAIECRDHCGVSQKERRLKELLMTQRALRVESESIRQRLATRPARARRGGPLRELHRIGEQRLKTIETALRETTREVDELLGHDLLDRAWRTISELQRHIDEEQGRVNSALHVSTRR